MKSSTQEIIPMLGTARAGGFYAGRSRIGDQVFALIVPHKAEGERSNVIWSKSKKIVVGAMSFNDGLANTQAMAAAGSELAQWALDLHIGEHADFYLPSQDELEIIYRNLKPGTATNSLYGRSGINVSAVIPTDPYTADNPVQTSAELFQAGGAEAFEEDAYWTSTQHAAYADYAWYQIFGNGGQGNTHKSAQLCARAIRRSVLE